LIPHSRPSLGDDDARAVARVVRGGWIAQGPEVAAFEAEVAARLGVAATAAVSSGTTALELALRALGIGAGDDVVVPTYACDALHHAVVRAGARPLLADADPRTHALAVEDVRRRLTPRTRALVLVHPFGRAVPVRPFLALGIPVVEDCAQALGAIVDDRPAGAWGAAAICSFYATKLVTTGEGGAVGGPDELAARVRAARAYDEREALAAGGGNAKLTDIQAALGRSQLARLDAFVARRRRIAARYRAALAGARCATPEDAGAAHVYHRFVVEVERPVDGVIAALGARGVTARRPVFRPIHQAVGAGGYPEAERLWQRSVSLPCYPSLADGEVDAVAAALREVVG
jgi:dTDP-4-amino-4,6-dideoxygalactose transaminase